MGAACKCPGSFYARVRDGESSIQGLYIRYKQKQEEEPEMAGATIRIDN